MSDPKRATIITVGAPKSEKNKVNKTVRLTINLDESNESKYPELNYKELLIAAAKKKKVENGKTTGLDPFSDNDDDVERVARKFEQKYGGKSTYGRKGRSKYEDFADIGAGYDENDSFIDNTHGYDEMIPPECDTLYGGFYINSGSLEFKTVPENQTSHSDGDGRRHNKRRISSSSSEEESSDSSSDSDSQDVKDKPLPNGTVNSHKTEHRKKKNKKNNKKKAKSVTRTDSTAATSGKQTSDEAGICEGSSTSQSDSLTSKPAPSSENVVTSDSSRDTEAKTETKLPQIVTEALEEIEALSKELKNNSGKDCESKTDQCVLRLEQSLNKCSCEKRARREAWGRAARALRCSRAKLLQRANALKQDKVSTSQTQMTTTNPAPITTNSSVTTNLAPITTNTSVTTNPAPVTTNSTRVNNSNLKRKASELDNEDYSLLSPEKKEAKIVETLQRLKMLIEERKPEMLANYSAECDRVQEERKKLQTGEGHVDKRLPKRRFPWCPLSRSLLVQLSRIAGTPAAAADVLVKRALPLFPTGFVRVPTLLRQADLHKDIKASEAVAPKRPRAGSTTTPTLPLIMETVQFPSSLTVTTTTTTRPAEKTIEKPNRQEPDEVSNHVMVNKILNSMTFNKDLIIEQTTNEPKKANHDTVTITAVPSKDKKEKKEPLLRVKSPAALNDMLKKDKKKREPLHIDTKEKFTQKQIETMKALENNIPHPALVPVHHSPTFAKPDKRPPEKKKKDVMIVSDVDPLADNQEPVAVDDSSSDIEVIEDRVNCDKVSESDTVPSDKSDKVSDKTEFSKDFENLMKDLQEMENSQEQKKANFNSFGGVITSERTSLKEIDGCNGVSG